MSEIVYYPVDNFEEFIENAKSEALGQEIHIQHKMFNCAVTITGYYKKILNFDTCIFNEKVRIFDANFKANLHFDSCTLNSEFTLNSVKFESKLVVDSVVFKSKLKIINSTLIDADLFLEECESLYIFNTICKKINIKSNYYETSFINEINLYSNSISGHIYIEGPNSKINKLITSGFSNDFFLSISNTEINNLYFDNFRTENGVRLIDINPRTDSEYSIFSIENSYLGKTELNKIGLNKYNIVTIEDSYIIDCIVTNIEWDFSKINNSKIHRNNRETFRQIKHALNKSSDFVNEQKAHGYEMRAYNNSLNWELKNLSTKIILYLSDWTSGFGQSILKPIIAIIGMQLFLVFLLISLGYYGDEISISIDNANYLGFQKATIEFFYLINPFRKTGEMMNTWYSIIIDLIMRIWSSYMIYNIIRASRRFIK